LQGIGIYRWQVKLKDAQKNVHGCTGRWAGGKSFWVLNTILDITTPEDPFHIQDI